MKRFRGVLTLGMIALFAVATTALTAGPAAAAATPVVVYNASIQPLPGNMPSEGPEAYAFSEMGDAVTFAGTQRTLNVVRVTLSSWACEQGTWNTHDCVTTPGDKFPVPITLNIYRASTAGPNDTVVPGSLITTATKTFQVPYRPTANLNKCNGANLGKWYKAASTTCFNGKAANVAFNFGSLGITLPNDVVIGVAYNSTHYGYSPIGEAAPCFGTPQGCFYDSLNIGLAPAVTVGSKPYPDTLFQNTSQPGQLCDGTPALGVFNLDSPTTACWNGYNPAIVVTAH